MGLRVAVDAGLEALLQRGIERISVRRSRVGEFGAAGVACLSAPFPHSRGVLPFPALAPRALILRWLDDPEVVDALPTLPAESFRVLLEAVGIEEGGQLLAMASPAQFEELVDDALWDDDGDFDPEGFGLWLELMLEGGEAQCVGRLSALPEETVALGFSAQLFVLDAEVLGLGMAGVSRHEAELVERALDASLYLELGNYTLVCRRALHWDETIAALLAVDQRDRGLLERILDACVQASTEYLESREGLEGLQSVLTAAEAMDEDADDGRARRRAARGYVDAKDARAFVRLAARPLDALPERDAITAAQLRMAEREGGRRPENGTPRALPAELRAFIERHAAGAGVRREGASAFARSLDSTDQRVFRAALSRLDVEASTARRWELAYLANALVAAGDFDPSGAAAEVLARCADGFARWAATMSERPSLEAVGCDQLFRLGRSKTV